MIVLIPIGGSGERFVADNYKTPKPLINVLGKPMINWVIESLKLSPEDQLFIVHRDELNHFNFQAQLKNTYPNLKIHFIELNFNTRGAVETVLYGLKNMNSDDLCKPVMICDCDTFYIDDVVANYEEEGGNCIFFFKDTGSKPIFSYITFDEGKVSAIKEKVKISDNANTGLYCFESGSVLKELCDEVLNSQFKENAEFYISDIYRKMISNGIPISAIEVEKFHCLGTPFQLQMFAVSNSKYGEKQRFCFDFDNTLVSFPKVKNDYSTVEPIHQMINFAKFLKNKGHDILIHTARRMKTHKGNVGAVIADIAATTIDTIKKFNIPCDELYFGKPYADFYIDDKAINPFLEPQKEMGFYNNDVESRHFNSVVHNDETVIKTSTSSSFKGELFWYSHMPEKIKDLFPKFKIENETLTLEKIKGINLSYLFVNNSLTESRLNELMTTMEKIHDIGIIDLQDEDYIIDQKKVIYKNYEKKLAERYNHDYYSRFDKSYNLFICLAIYLRNYEIEKRAICRVIHGDPVFTNIIIEKDKNFKFIDMRGIHGDWPSIYGDIFYDYAKIYQSLVGYDFILHNQKINSDYIEPLKEQFKSFIIKKYNASRFEDIRMITKSLLFSLLPLHKNDKCQQYYDLIKKV